MTQRNEKAAWELSFTLETREGLNARGNDCNVYLSARLMVFLTIKHDMFLIIVWSEM